MVLENIKILSHNELLERIIPFPFFMKLLLLDIRKSLDIMIESGFLSFTI